MALIDYNQIKEVTRELLKGFFFFFFPVIAWYNPKKISNAGSNLCPVILVIAAPNGLKSLVDQYVKIGKKESAFDSPAFPQSPDDLKGRVGFASPSRHDQHDTFVHGLASLHRSLKDFLQELSPMAFEGCQGFVFY